MKLSKIKNLGRFEHKQTCQAVNLKKGRNAQRGTDVMFYLFKGKRIFITDEEFYSRKLWVKID